MARLREERHIAYLLLLYKSTWRERTFRGVRSRLTMMTHSTMRTSMIKRKTRRIASITRSSLAPFEDCVEGDPSSILGSGDAPASQNLKPSSDSQQTSKKQVYVHTCTSSLSSGASQYCSVMGYLWQHTRRAKKRVVMLCM